MKALTNATRRMSTTNGSNGKTDPGAVPPAVGADSSPVSKFARLNASAATIRTARNRSTGTAHAGLPRRSQGTSLRRRSPLITVSRSPVDSASTPRRLGDAEPLEEPLPPTPAVDAEAEREQAAERREDERQDHKADAPEGRLRGRRSGGLIAQKAVGPEDRRGEHDVQRADRGEHDRGGQSQGDRDALRMQDLTALVRQLVVDPLAALIDALHEARGLQLLEVLEECRLAQFEEVAQVRDGLAPHVKAFEDADAHVRGERLEALLVEGDLRRARVHPARAIGPGPLQGMPPVREDPNRPRDAIRGGSALSVDVHDVADVPDQAARAREVSRVSEERTSEGRRDGRERQEPDHAEHPEARELHAIPMLDAVNEACAKGNAVYFGTFCQSSRNRFNPTSVRACCVIFFRMSKGRVTMSAPSFAASMTWSGWRIDATRTSQSHS